MTHDLINAGHAALPGGSELLQATQALAESEARFRKLVDLNPNAIAIQSEGRWRFANATALAMFGAASLEAFQARPVLDWIHPSSLEAARERVGRVMSGRPQPEQELLLLREDGSTFPAMVHGILFDHQGLPSILGVIRDITEQKEMDAALQRARDSYQSLLMEMPFLVWKGTPEGGCEYVNQAWMDFTGLSLDELQGNQWAERVHPEDQLALMQAYGAAMANLEPMAMDFRMLHREGSYRWVQGQGKPFYDLDGAFDGFLAACSDIHDSRMAEAALAESEQRFRTVADFTYDWEYWLGKDGRFRWMSPSSERVTGYPPEAFTQNPELMGRILHPDDRSMLEDHVHEVRDGGEPFPMEFRIFHKDGRQVWISHICTPVYGSDGQSLGRRAANRDITARRQAEEDLFEASRQRLAMLEAASVARVVPWSMGSDGRMQWGDSANLVLGQTPTVLGHRRGWPWETIQEQDRPRLHQALREVDMGFVASFECRMRHGQGQVIWTRWTLAREQGSFHGAIQDITEQHTIHEQLLQSQKLESMGTLVGGIAHDFNNLLGAILGYCELFEADPELSPRHQKGMGVIQGAAKRGRELVGKLMGFSRKVAPNRVQASLNTLVSEASELVAHALPSELRLQLELWPDLPDIHLDPGQLHQVVMNLAINARDAIQGEGLITLRSGRQEITPEQGLALQRLPGPYVYLEVEDTGCGIPEDQLSRVFEPFYTTKGMNGTGLGLSMAYGLVAEHGGFMECHSELGQGTRFRVMLPVQLHGLGAPALPA
ncbi:MAG: PAS domain S-box protein [Holophagaceae bacterium]|uniref:histidine kinase n=1 Tax=Candidatus Geothrix skivensis TaxID=2954439 RepID=A0A9D7SHP2_9BACT|nr:PAS domain S-box protein [Candidatus Geothrix skivensis]